MGRLSRKSLWTISMVVAMAGLADAGPAQAQEPAEPAESPPHTVLKAAVDSKCEARQRCEFRCEGGGPSLELRRLRDWMSGTFSSAAQAAEDPESFLDIRLQMVPIWTDREDGCWLYVEQAVADHQEEPYRQRVYRLRQLDEDLFESRVYTFENPLARAGAWRQEKPLAELSPEDLSERQGCAILLRGSDGRFSGSTLGRLCESSLRGATFATSEVVITPGQLVSWDRGFDDSGRHIWGAEKGGYVFVKAEKR